jgi:hypothetical protein
MKYLSKKCPASDVCHLIDSQVRALDAGEAANWSTLKKAHYAGFNESNPAVIHSFLAWQRTSDDRGEPHY